MRWWFSWSLKSSSLPYTIINFLYVHTFCTCAHNFYNFFFLLEWKNQTQSFSLHLWNYLINLKILLVTRFKDPKAAILTLKMLTGSRLWFCTVIPKAAGDMLILAHFPCSQWEVGTREDRPIKEEEILRRVSVSIFNINK